MTSRIDKTRDNIYVNVVISPLEANGTNNTLAKYQETLTNPLLMNPSEYYLSVIRFQLPIDQICLFKMPIDVTQADPDRTYLQIGVVVGGIPYTQNVIYVPMNNIPAPAPSAGPIFFTNQQSVSDYYSVFSIQHMLNMINTALGLAHVASGVGGSPAYYEWDSATELISCYVPTTYIGVANIFINKYLKDYLSSFQYSLNTATNIYTMQYNANLPVVTGFRKHVEEYTSIAQWFDMRKIMLVSRQIPVAPETLPDQRTEGITQLYSSVGLSSSMPIITDFCLSYDNFNQISSVVVYNPSSEYRLCDLIGETPLRNIDIQFLYLDRFGNQFPIYISPSQEATIKLAFFRKDLYLRK